MALDSGNQEEIIKACALAKSFDLESPVAGYEEAQHQLTRGLIDLRGPLWLAIKMALWPAAYALIDKLSATEIIEQHDENERNALVWSAFTVDCSEATEVGVKILEKTKGERIDRTDKLGSTAIMFAAQNRRKALVEAMLAFHPDVAIKSRSRVAE